VYDVICIQNISWQEQHSQYVLTADKKGHRTKKETEWIRGTLITVVAIFSNHPIVVTSKEKTKYFGTAEAPNKAVKLWSFVQPEKL
jgi:hypothetical protein